jgi:hypothetical protein
VENYFHFKLIKLDFFADAFRASNNGRSMGGGISVQTQDEPEDAPPPPRPFNKRP